MWRFLTLALAVGAALGMGGCSQNGSFQLDWTIALTRDGQSTVEKSPADGCGQGGIDSLAILGNDLTGDGDQIQALCTPGRVTGSVPEGTWSFQVQMVDSRGALFPGSAVVTDPQPIAAGGAPVSFSVVLTAAALPSSDPALE